MFEVWVPHYFSSNSMHFPLRNALAYPTVLICCVFIIRFAVFLISFVIYCMGYVEALC